MENSSKKKYTVSYDSYVKGYDFRSEDFWGQYRPSCSRVLSRCSNAKDAVFNVFQAYRLNPGFQGYNPNQEEEFTYNGSLFATRIDFLKVLGYPPSPPQPTLQVTVESSDGRSLSQTVDILSSQKATTKKCTQIARELKHRLMWWKNDPA